ncbi:hypothetical protein GCK32_000479 [Trichostrongylus colubriformis]|uniref:Secreted protein n=1 Tax=Trichostrongylus colubriformis TaxID=6319 RepID=A0AAN8EY42_TRICO
MSTLLLLLPVTMTLCQLHNGGGDPHLPTVVLTGEPRLIARRIWRGMEISDVMRNVQAREPFHLHPVNVHESGNRKEGRPVTVYRKVIRPAKLFYTGEGIVMQQWVGGNDNNERRLFFRELMDETRRRL